MTDTGADMRTMTLEKGLATFLNALTGKNRSAATIRAYSTDIAQFISFLHANNVSIHTPAEVEKIDVMEYLSALGDSTVNRGHEHQRAIRRCSAREGRPRRFGGDQRASGT
jgi:site-specific recombinase XerD